MALLFSTVKSGNSEIARGLAEYTDAPASLTIIYSTFLFASLIVSAMNASLSRDAVPFPIAMTSILYFSINSRTIFLLSSILLCGSVG